jgi:hypothetical protein
MSVLGLVMGLAACGSSKSEAPKDEPPKERPQTSGPIESIVHKTDLVMRLDAVRHRVELPDTPLAGWIGLPVRGTAEVDADVTMPLVDGKPAYNRANGTIAIRCIKDCRIGDDVAKLKVEAAKAFAEDGIYFGHIDIEQLDVKAEVRDGKARVTSWTVRSPDVELDASASAELAADPGASTVDACVHFKATDALKQRDAKLAALLDLVGGWRAPDGTNHITATGTLDTPSAKPVECAVK